MSLLRLRTSLVLNSRVTKNAIVWHTAATAPLQGVGFPIQLGIRVVARTRAQVHCELLTGGDEPHNNSLKLTRRAALSGMLESPAGRA
jgi:hypothetical protein